MAYVAEIDEAAGTRSLRVLLIRPTNRPFHNRQRLQRSFWAGLRFLTFHMKERIGWVMYATDHRDIGPNWETL